MLASGVASLTGNVDENVGSSVCVNEKEGLHYLFVFVGEGNLPENGSSIAHVQDAVM